MHRIPLESALRTRQMSGLASMYYIFFGPNKLPIAFKQLSLVRSSPHCLAVVLHTFNMSRTVNYMTVRHVTGTGSGLLGGIPRVVVQMSALTKRATIGVRAPYATRRKLRYEANQVWMNTTFISQGPQSSGIKRSKPEGLRQN